MLPLEWGLILPFWLSGPPAPALSCHLGEAWSPQVGEGKHSSRSLMDSPQPPLTGGETFSMGLWTDDSPPMNLSVLACKMR